MAEADDVLVCSKCYQEALKMERICRSCGTSLLSYSTTMNRDEAKGLHEQYLASQASQTAAPAAASAPPSRNRLYLEKLRAASCYPAFRGFIGFCTVVGYLLAGLVLLIGIFSGSFTGILGGFIGAEASLMLADIADATIDSSSQQNIDATADN
jgi:hypothetical protein